MFEPHGLKKWGFPIPVKVRAYQIGYAPAFYETFKINHMNRYRLLLSILICSVSIICYAQRRNNRGQKIVSSVRVEKFLYNGGVENTTDVTYTYDSNFELIRMTRVITVEDESAKDVIQRQKDGKIKSTTYYNGRIDRNYKHEYEVNEYGLIKSKTTKYMINNDSVQKVTSYEYEDSEEDGVVLRQIKRRQYVKDGKTWSPAHTIDYINFDYWDGDCYWAKGHCSNFNVSGEFEYYDGEVKYKEGKYGKIKNDTNINPNLFMSMLCWEICLDSHEYELSSEWCGMKSAYILDCEEGIRIYPVVDSNGNLVELLTKNKKGNPYMRMTIKYQM